MKLNKKGIFIGICLGVITAFGIVYTGACCVHELMYYFVKLKN